MAILGAIGGLAAAGAGLYAANATAAANRANNRLAQQQFALQQRLAQQQLEMAQAATRDARGNVVEYIPGVGWIERPSGRTRQLMDASDREELLRLTQDAPRSRMRREQTFRRGLQESALADAIMRQMAAGYRSPEQVRSAELRAGVAEAAAAPNALRGAINMTALRQGSGGETALAELARRGIADRRSIIARADAAGPGQFAEAENTRLTGPLNRYNMLASRASAPDDVPFQANSLADALSAGRQRQQMVAPQAIGSAMGVRAPTMQPVEDRSLVRLAGFSQALGDFLENDRVRSLFGTLFNNRSSGSTPPVSNYSAWEAANGRW